MKKKKVEGEYYLVKYSRRSEIIGKAKHETTSSASINSIKQFHIKYNIIKNCHCHCQHGFSFFFKELFRSEVGLNHLQFLLP